MIINLSANKLFFGEFIISGKTPDDDVRLSTLNLKSNTKIMMMGTREENLAEVISPSEELLNNQVINDFDIEEEEIQIENRSQISCRDRCGTYETISP